MRRLERRIAADATAVTVVSNAEAELFRRVCPNEKTVGVTNGVDLDYFDTATTSRADRRHTCVFVGVLDYRANVEGLQWFCSRVWPEVRRCSSDATFVIVGRHPAAAVERLSDNPGVELVGEVPDVRPYVAGAEMAVAPLQVARGIQNKVLEALAMRTAVVASPQALEGLSVQNGRHVAEANSPDEWVRAIVQLHKDSEYRTRLATAGRAYVEEQHCWATCLVPFEEYLGLRGALRRERRPDDTGDLHAIMDRESKWA